ncbi:hypothetical protein BDN67DRAFT_1017782 [Paxillus ammoniavirescens]|nr:hypothetical protein BDN67DRAFT_1017782 [Paxillus ammoniavirescens]
MGDVHSLDLTTPVGNTVVEPRGNIKMVSSGSSVAGEADHQRDILHLQEQNEQLRRQLDDVVAVIRKAEAERDGPATKTHHLLTIYCTQVTNNSGSFSLDLGSRGVGPSSTQDGPPRGSELITDPQTDPSTFSNILCQGHPSCSVQFISHSIGAEEQANEKGKESVLSDQTNKVTDSSHSVYAPHNHSPTRPTMGSPASTAADMANVQRVLLQLQQQVKQLRQRVDDPMRKVAAERDGLDTGGDHPVTINCTQITNDAGFSLKSGSNTVEAVR